MAVQLVVQTPASARELPLEGTLTFGRAPDNVIRLDDIDVSRHHASLVVTPDGAMFTDLGSANGSRVNGREVEPRVAVRVQPGDTIGLGNCSLVLRPAGGPRPSPSPAVPPPAAVTSVLRFEPTLDIVTRASSRTVALAGDAVTIGRAADNTIVVDADVISRHHLVLRRSGLGYRAEDLGTTNGMTGRGGRAGTPDIPGGDETAVGADVLLRSPPAPPAPAAEAERELRLDVSKAITIGRDASCDLCLAHPTVSKLHARISPAPGGQRVIEDLGSTNGTFVNGVRLNHGEWRTLLAADTVQVGPVRVHLTGAGVVEQVDHSRDIRIAAVHLNQRVNAKLNLLQDISVVIEPREFVAVVGVSGSGKSTLLGALSGLRPATDGDVLLNETSLYTHFEAFRTTLGYVPQDDILHKELPVARALSYAAELRLPDDTPPAERGERVESVLQTLGLVERRETPVGRLSGGQRKRVSIGAELLTQPGLFFLDEATSGLDPGTESQLMRLLRHLADEGHTILLITHATKNVMLCDQVLFLARGGNLAYFGPPDEALGYFGVPDFDGIYEKLESNETTPEEWGARYLASAQYQRFVSARLAALPAASGGAAPAVPAGAGGRTSSAGRQLRVLSRRYFDLIRRDRVNLMLLFLLAPALSLIDLVAWPHDVLDPVKGEATTAMTMLFLAALIPFLIGSLSSVREIVKEAPIYARERAVSLKIWPYLGSKVAVGALFAFYHAGILLGAKVLLIDYPGADSTDFLILYVTLVLAVVAGVMWALLISTLTSKEEQAMMLVIGLIVVQVVFSGGLVNLDDLGVAGLVLGSITPTSWALKALAVGFGISTDGCTGDLAACNLPGIPGMASPEVRTATFGTIDDKFGPVFNADILVCWGAMAAIIVVLGVALYVLQKRKDTL
ncbi:MAG TPA: FHA domain-containing protein [Tepidiformaceae bacterium]|nr:FHA domain-containing protein [Tepidiformaceae bacterium]